MGGPSLPPILEPELTLLTATLSLSLRSRCPTRASGSTTRVPASRSWRAPATPTTGTDARTTSRTWTTNEWPSERGAALDATQVTGQPSFQHPLMGCGSYLYANLC